MAESVKHSTKENLIFVDRCHNGKEHFPPNRKFLQFFRDLCASPELQAKNFRSNIRRYNNAMSMESVTAIW